MSTRDYYDELADMSINKSLEETLDFNQSQIRVPPQIIQGGNRSTRTNTQTWKVVMIYNMESLFRVISARKSIMVLNKLSSLPTLRSEDGYHFTFTFNDLDAAISAVDQYREEVKQIIRSSYFPVPIAGFMIGRDLIDINDKQLYRHMSDTCTDMPILIHDSMAGGLRSHSVQHNIHDNQGRIVKFRRVIRPADFTRTIFKPYHSILYEGLHWIVSYNIKGTSGSFSEANVVANMVT